MPKLVLGFFLSLLLLCSVDVCKAQQDCPQAPSLQPTSGSENIFSDAQEVDLGDAMAETVALHLNVIQADEPTAHLHEIGAKLIRYLPPTQLKFRFYLVDLPEVNAFSIAGGRVYVSRKLVAFARNDDELAGVLAHELGHIVTHQTAIAMTRAFKDVLGVTQVGDRDDIFRQYHKYLENARRTRRSGRDEGEKHQIIADQVEVFTLARAGFSTQAAAELWDRFTEVHGKTGSWLTDFFGATTSAQHRLREILKSTASLPTACVDHARAQDAGSYTAWQQVVVEYEDKGRAENLPGLLLKRRFTDRLRPEITNIRFSNDGRYILAQDDGGINVVSYKPFALIFYIPAPDAREAKFSPDSNLIVFATTGMRVETWSISEQKRKSVHEITVRVPCLQTELSPDGGLLACLNRERTLQLFDVNSGSSLYEEKDFWRPSGNQLLSLLLTAAADRDPESTTISLQFVNMSFTPDGHYFLAAYGTPQLEAHRGTSYDPATGAPTISWYAEHQPGYLMYDATAKTKMNVPNSIEDEASLSFSFLGSGRMVGINYKSPKKSRVLAFPSGEAAGDVELWQGINLRGATHGDILFVGPLKEYPLGVIDLVTKERKIVISQKTADMYDGVFVTERISGQLALRTKDSEQPVAVLQLPEGHLGRLHAAVASPNLDYLAVSSRTRGALWDVAHDFKAYQLRRFSEVGFDGPAFYVDLPEFLGFSRQTAELHIDSGAHSFHELKEDSAVQHGLYVSVIKPRNSKGPEHSNADLEMRDIRTGKVLWTRYFPEEVPTVDFESEDGTLIFRWRIPKAGGPREELNKFPQVQSKVGEGDYFCETVDASSGQAVTAFAIKTNDRSLYLQRARANRAWAVAEASGDQVLVYALPSGEEKESFFGSRPAFSTAGALAVESGRREIALYDLGKNDLLRRYTFAAPVSFKSFSADGKQLIVLTADQTVYLLDVTSAKAPQQVASQESAARK